MDDTKMLVIYLSIATLIALALLILAFWFTSWFSKNSQGKSPYSGQPLRSATELSYFAAEKVLRYLYDYHEYDNRIFKLKKAAFCRETGRLFQDCITWYGAIKVNWDFLQKRYPGQYVSWGSLNSDQKKAIREAHDNLDGFQTEVSSPTISPRLIEPKYVFTKPGPLYVDIESKVLLGWKEVPETELEVLIVQKPVR